MKLNNNTLYHIFNQGNNRQKIFFNENNYNYFLWKMRGHLFPFGDIVAYCLMPNHYHWLFYLKNEIVLRKKYRLFCDEIENRRRVKTYGSNAKLIDLSEKNFSSKDKTITINESIGILQKSYAQAINKEQNRTGSLFRQSFKAKDGWLDEFVTLKKNNKVSNLSFNTDSEYAIQCFNYIHENPVVAGLVHRKNDWAYSSSRDYDKLRSGTLCNMKIGNNLKEYI